MENPGPVAGLTQRQKMLSGQPYEAWDPELMEARRQARQLLREINAGFGGDAGTLEGLFLKLFGSMGGNTAIEPPFYCDYGKNIHLGSDVFFNFNCTILDPAKVTIGDRCLFGPGVQIYTATHPLDSVVRAAGLEGAREIAIGSDVWVGGGTIILPGVRIGSRSVIGAGSVVTKDVPEGVLAAGNPCKVLRPIA
jgi:maltose O-acetyltransferase